LPAPDTRLWRHLYGRARWKALREAQLTAEPLCQMCLEFEIVELATVVDHKIPHKGDETLFFDPENLQSLCKPHHDREKKLIEMGKDIPIFGADGWRIN
jgi:5-methylcytosine-specific restriction protein A